MKLGKLSLIAATAAVVLCLQSASVWAIRALGVTVTGQVTASPSPTQIEIAHHLYHIQPNSPASRTARSFFLGQNVDAILSAPGVNAEPEVVSLVLHPGS
jgi:hypothetical protein